MCVYKQPCLHAVLLPRPKRHTDRQTDRPTNRQARQDRTRQKIILLAFGCSMLCRSVAWARATARSLLSGIGQRNANYMIPELHVSTSTDLQTDRQTGRQAGRQAEGQTDRHTERRTDRQTVTQRDIHASICAYIHALR